MKVRCGAGGKLHHPGWISALPRQATQQLQRLWSETQHTLPPSFCTLQSVSSRGMGPHPQSCHHRHQNPVPMLQSVS